MTPELFPPNYQPTGGTVPRALGYLGRSSCFKCDFKNEAAVAQWSRYRIMAVDMVTHSGPACHEFENDVEDSPFRGLMHIKTAEAQCPSVGLMWLFGYGCKLKCGSRHLTEAQNFEVRCQ
ncbi:hypothetical protein TNCV_1911871 [Trichonephila clavipes]|nr:hypothetical protein TNCV_1911871 [Trichonephila clavipes]